MPTIPTAPGLAALGWDEDWASALAELGDPTLLPARVSRVDRGVCTVMTGTDVVRVAAERGVEVAVGDWVAIAPGPADGDRPADRRRPSPPVRLPAERPIRRGAAPQIVAANIDTVLLCDALDGRLSLRHLERYLALAWQSGATPVVLITKSDAASAAAVAEAVKTVEAVADGASVVVVSSTTGEGIGDLAPYLVPGRTVALLGLSGAGKSTLVNLLAGADILATGAVRRDGKGRHTTTHRQLVLLPGGGLLIDTPGMRALSVVGAGEGVEQAFRGRRSPGPGLRVRQLRPWRRAGLRARGRGVRRSPDPAPAGELAPVEGRAPVSDYGAARRGVEDRKRRKATKTADRRTARP